MEHKAEASIHQRYEGWRNYAAPTELVLDHYAGAGGVARLVVCLSGKLQVLALRPRTD